MKTMKFWFVMAVAVIMTSMAFVSCSEDDPIIPEIIESEVLESGLDEEVVSSTSDDAGASGTTLSYQSWILVKGQTRANFENKVTVTLNNRFNNVVEEKEVSNFNFGNPTISTEIRKSDSRVEQNYVTVTDSVLVYKLTYENDFSFEYELLYQVPEYNDGITKQMMPYYSIGKIVDNGVKLSGMDALEENGKTYQRKLCQHSITVTFNGKEYDVGASIVLKSEAREDYLVSSKVVDEGIEELSYDSEKASYKSWIKVEQVWSESGTKTKVVEATLHNSIYASSQTHKMNLPEKYDWMNPISLVMSEVEAVKDGVNEGDEVTITTYKLNRDMSIAIKATEEKLAELYTTFYYSKAVYKDDILTYDMPGYIYEGHEYIFEFSGSEWVERNGKWYHPIKLVSRANLNGREYANVYTNEFVYTE